jgi:hypothetical protein
VAETNFGVDAQDCTADGCAYPTVWQRSNQTAYQSSFTGVAFGPGNILFNTGFGKYYENVTTVPYLYYKATGQLTADSILSAACRDELGLEDTEYYATRRLLATQSWSTTSGFEYDMTFEIKGGAETFKMTETVAAGDATKAIKLPVNITKQVSMSLTIFKTGFLKLIGSTCQHFSAIGIPSFGLLLTPTYIIP